MKNPSNAAIELAASAWTKPETSNIEMNTKIAYAFAEIIDEIRSKPYLGNATTRELIYELSARCDTGSIDKGGNYKTTGE
jgi:hypothetical protein